MRSSLLQVMAEGLPQLLRCVVVVCGVLLAPQLGLTVFCAAQVSSRLRPVQQSPPPSPPLPSPPLPSPPLPSVADILFGVRRDLLRLLLARGQVT